MLSSEIAFYKGKQKKARYMLDVGLVQIVLSPRSRMIGLSFWYDIPSYTSFYREGVEFFRDRDGSTDDLVDMLQTNYSADVAENTCL